MRLTSALQSVKKSDYNPKKSNKKTRIEHACQMHRAGKSLLPRQVDLRREFSNIDPHHSRASG
jgi:hypothetical protein